MSARRLYVLVALALAVTAGAIWLVARRPSQRDADVGAAVLPGLAAALDRVASLRLVGAGERTLVTLTKNDGEWVVVEAGYLADAARVRRVLVALGELHIQEGKTQDPARYAALGVEDVGGAAAQSIRVELGGLKAPVALLVGRAAGHDGSYVRVPGTAQAKEARPTLELARTPDGWLARTVVDLAPERVQSVEVARSDGPAWRALRAGPDAAHFDVPGLPSGRELKQLAAADGAAGVLAGLNFEELRRDGGGPGHARRDRAVVKSFDGLVVTLEGWAEGEQRWITIATRIDAAAAPRSPAAAAVPPAAGVLRGQEEALRIERTTHGWQYRVPGYRYDSIFRKRDDVLRH